MIVPFTRELVPGTQGYPDLKTLEHVGRTDTNTSETEIPLQSPTEGQIMGSQRYMISWLKSILQRVQRLCRPILQLVSHLRAHHFKWIYLASGITLILVLWPGRKPKNLLPAWPREQIRRNNPTPLHPKKVVEIKQGWRCEGSKGGGPSHICVQFIWKDQRNHSQWWWTPMNLTKSLNAVCSALFTGTNQ